MKRIRRASCTVWTVALLPEPWKARRVGFMLLYGEPFGGSLRVMYVGFCCEAMVELMRFGMPSGDEG
jgi:hypothetical protein